MTHFLPFIATSIVSSHASWNKTQIVSIEQCVDRIGEDKKALGGRAIFRKIRIISKLIFTN